MRILTIILFLLVSLAGRPGYAQSNTPPYPDPEALIGPTVPYGQRVMLAPGDSAERIFGTLLVRYRLLRSGTAVQCTLYVATQLAGIRQLSPASPTYAFDVQVTYGQARGTVTLQPASSQQGQISTLTGSFDYTSSNGQWFTFKGDLIGWYPPP